MMVVLMLFPNFVVGCEPCPSRTRWLSRSDRHGRIADFLCQIVVGERESIVNSSKWAKSENKVRSKLWNGFGEFCSKTLAIVIKVRDFKKDEVCSFSRQTV